MSDVLKDQTKMKLILLVSFSIALITCLPTSWISYKGEYRPLNIFQVVLSGNLKYTFLDFSLLAVNTLVIFITFLLLIILMKRLKNRR